MSDDDIKEKPYRPCVGVMLANKEGEVFVGQRIDNKDPAWQMPQGGVDEDEEPERAALRELWEETGVLPALVTVEAETEGWISYDLPADLAPRIWGGKFRGQTQKWFLLRFEGSDDDINIATLHPEFSEWRWLPPGELVDAIVPFKREVYRRVLEEFEDKL
jgi:putative (di)nucleoside polyphosphate hydrolase